MKQLVTLLICIWEIYGSNLVQDTDYLHYSFLLFPSVQPMECWKINSN